MKKLKLSEVYEEAARLLDLDYCSTDEAKRTCCDAIGAAQGVHYSVETTANRMFIDLFKPTNAFECDCWMGDVSCPDAKEHRIWAMLFMAEITRKRR